MKSSKLLEKLKYYFDAERREQLAKYDSLKRVLKKLKKKEEHLLERINQEKNEDESILLKNKLNVLFAQRKKGVKLKKELKRARANIL